MVSIGQLQRLIDLKWSLIYNIIIFKPVLKLANLSKTSIVTSSPIRFCIVSLLDFVDCLFLFFSLGCVYLCSHLPCTFDECVTIFDFCFRVFLLLTWANGVLRLILTIFPKNVGTYGTWVASMRTNEGEFFTWMLRKFRGNNLMVEVYYLCSNECCNLVTCSNQLLLHYYKPCRNSKLSNGIRVWQEALWFCKSQHDKQNKSTSYIPS